MVNWKKLKKRLTPKWQSPTLLSTALAIAVVSTIIVFVIIEVLWNLLGELGFTQTVSGTVLVVMFVGVVVSMTILFSAMRRKIVYVYN